MKKTKKQNLAKKVIGHTTRTKNIKQFKSKLLDKSIKRVRAIPLSHYMSFSRSTLRV